MFVDLRLISRTDCVYLCEDFKKYNVMETNSNSSSVNSSSSVHRRNINNSPKNQGAVLGVLLIVAGILFLSLNFGWIDSSLRWVIFSWPMIFIVLSVISFTKKDFAFGLVWLIGGLFFLLPRLATVYPDYFSGINPNFSATYWPVLLIILGIIIVFRIGTGKNRVGSSYKHGVTNSTENIGGRVNKSVTFSGSESIFLDPVFNGGSLNAVFGGVVLDLRKTTLPVGETYLDISAVFGGIELSVPDDWYVESNIQSIFGGVEDKRLVAQTDTTRKLILQGSLIFGGCEIS